MLLLGHLLLQSPRWRQGRLVLHTIVEDEADYADSLTAVLESLPTTVFVRNGSEFAGQLI